MHSSAHHHHHGEQGKESTKKTRGLILDWGWSYDLMVWFFDVFIFWGKLRALRPRTADLAQLQKGETVLDVGCGTGDLALEAYTRVGGTGRVFGIDPAVKQLARARSKASRRNLPIDFQVGVIEQLPFPDQSVDAVLSTLMMHHLPDDLKRQGLAEILRVLKPGGRLVVVDARRSEKSESRSTHLGAGEMGIQDLPALIEEAGFSQIESGDMLKAKVTKFAQIGFVRARKS